MGAGRTGGYETVQMNVMVVLAPAAGFPADAGSPRRLWPGKTAFLAVLKT